MKNDRKKKKSRERTDNKHEKQKRKKKVQGNPLRKKRKWSRRIAIHPIHLPHHLRLQPPDPQTPLKQLLVDRKLHPACEVLSRDQILDHPRDQPLLVHVDQRLELHRWWERRERLEDLGLTRRVKADRVRVDGHGFVRRRRIDEVGKLAIAIQLREVDT